MSHSLPEEDLLNWKRYVDSFRGYSEASKAILAPDIDRPGLVRAALARGGMDKLAVLHILPYLSVDDLKELFELIVDWCATGHSVSPNFRAAIKRLPRDWVLDRIEAAAEPLLDAGSDEEYRRLLELYAELDRDLADRLARRASQHEDPHIIEVGLEFLEYLGGSKPAGPPDPADPPAGSRPMRHLAF